MRLLLAEDNAALVDELLPLLKASGYAVDVTGDGDETLFLGENESYDAVILDLGLPRRNGLDVLKQWRGEQRIMPVLILTARDTWRDKVDGLKAGADDYLAKPFKPADLIRKIDRVKR